MMQKKAGEAMDIQKFYLYLRRIVAKNWPIPVFINNTDIFDKSVSLLSFTGNLDNF